MGTHTGESYRDIAAAYADSVDTRPWNALYERPAMLSQLPPLEGRAVLDVACGSGWYAEQLLARGARVTAFDLNAEFVRRTQARVGDRARVLRADLAAPLAFAADAEFDLAICPLVLHYLHDWVPALRELRRALKPGGTLLFSTHHPAWDWGHYQREDYFAIEELEDYWEGVGDVRFYRRPLNEIGRSLEAAGFLIERLLEPWPVEEFRDVDPEGYEVLMKNPWFLVIRARAA
jgi:SAM-dependent methyltransferase